MNQQFKAGQYWLGISIAEDKHPFIRYITYLDDTCIQYRFWSSTDDIDNGELLNSSISWAEDKWMYHMQIHQLRLVPTEKALMLVNMWTSDPSVVTPV